MFDFIRKSELFEVLDAGGLPRFAPNNQFHLKTIQDCAIWNRLRGAEGLRIAEIGGGNSRLLPHLSENNLCVNVEKFEGAGLGPTENRCDVEVVPAYLGDFSPLLAEASFDVVFSVSVVEHVPGEKLADFHQDQLRILKPGGRFIHAIDIYLVDGDNTAADARCERYREWLRNGDVEPAGPMREGPVKFECDMCSNTDLTMWQWGKISPQLIELRKRAQSVSIIVEGRRVAASE